LKVKWSTYHRLLISRHGWSLYLIISIASRLHLLTQFMRAQSPQPLLVISWIFRLKNACFVFLTIYLNCFQSLICFDDLYFSISLLQLAFYQLFDHLVILTVFECWAHKISMAWVMDWTELLREVVSVMLKVSITLKDLISSLMNFFFSSLSLIIVCFLVWNVPQGLGC